MPEIRYESVLGGGTGWYLNNSTGLLSVTSNGYLYDTLRPFRMVGKVDPNDAVNPVNIWHPRTDATVAPMVEGRYLLEERIINGPTPIKYNYTDLNTEKLGIELMRGGVQQLVQITFGVIATPADVVTAVGGAIVAVYGGVASDYCTLSDGGTVSGRLRISTDINDVIHDSGDYVRILSAGHATHPSTNDALDYLGFFPDQITYAQEQNVLGFDGPGTFAQGFEIKSPGDSATSAAVFNRTFADIWAETASIRDYLLAMTYGTFPASDDSTEFSFTGTKNFLNSVQLYKDATLKNEWGRTENTPVWQPFTDVSTGNRIAGTPAFFDRQSTVPPISGTDYNRGLICEFVPPTIIGAGGDAVVWYGDTGSAVSYIYFGEKFYVAPLAPDSTSGNFYIGYPHIFINHQGNQFSTQTAIGTVAPWEVDDPGAGKYPFQHTFIGNAGAITNAISITKTYGCGIGLVNVATLGTSAFAVGNANAATGLNAFVCGASSTASGQESHAEGNTTTASGIASHSEGVGTLASNRSSHAEGETTTASGQYSHAEGILSTASADSAHSEGDSTIASGVSSHAEGKSTGAGGDYSHAEGNLTSAGGEAAHAEGVSTDASGPESHAEGITTEASGDSSHAEGNDTVASNQSSHAEGDTTSATGIASHAEGGNTLANNTYSHAEGSGSQARGAASHAEGSLTHAGGDASHCEGKGDGTLNYGSKAAYSHCEGDTNYVEGVAGHAEGQYTGATGLASHSEGGGYDAAHITNASGDYSHAEGLNTISTGEASHSQGVETIAYTDYSHSEGKLSRTHYDTSHSHASNKIFSATPYDLEHGSSQYERVVLTGVIPAASGSTINMSLDGTGFALPANYVYNVTLNLVAAEVDSSGVLVAGSVYAVNKKNIVWDNGVTYSVNGIAQEDVYNPGSVITLDTVVTAAPNRFHVEVGLDNTRNYHITVTCHFTEVGTV